MSTSTVRIGAETRIVLRELSARTGKPARVILRNALEDYRRKCFLEEANQAFAALKKDKKAWKAELDERRLWDSTLADESRDR
ncbi:MAG TPA: toxin-antitoxin system protein [Planctomycetota bacterium]|nr:toxin-antitoxin system protein [Planctomycetota bacterium]